MLRFRPLFVAAETALEAFSCLRLSGSSGALLAPPAACMSTSAGGAGGQDGAGPSTSAPEDSDFLIMDKHHFGPQPKLELVAKCLSKDHMNSADKFQQHKQDVIRELQAFDHDTGTMPVQIGLLSERISYLTKHCQTHKKDHHSRRGLLILLSRRRKQLKYLRKKDFRQYVQLITRYSLRDNYYQSGWGEKHRVGTSLKWTPAEPEKEKLPPAAEIRALLPVKRPAVHKKKERDLVQDALRAEIVKNRLTNINATMADRWARRAAVIPADFRQGGAPAAS